MLQRIQTIYLLLVLGIAIVLLFANIPLLDISIKDGSKHLITFQCCSYAGFSNLSIKIALITILIITFLNVFLFKIMMLQLRLSANIFVLMFVLYGAIFYSIYMILSEPQFIIEYQWGIYIPLLIGLFSILAFNSIKKDLRKIKSSRSIR